MTPDREPCMCTCVRHRRAAQDLSHQQLLLASACWLRDDLEAALQGCQLRLGQLLDELLCATGAELHEQAQQAMQQVEGGASLMGALRTLLSLQATGDGSSEPSD